MVDGKAPQAGTSHYLGTDSPSPRASPTRAGGRRPSATRRAGSTRLIGGVIMTHGDDDGLRVPRPSRPIRSRSSPMLRDDDGDAAILDYCEELRATLAGLTALGEPVRVLLDKREGKATQKRWTWVKKGMPIILEIGARDVSGGNVSVIRRDRLWREDGKTNFTVMTRDDFVAAAAAELEDVQRSLHDEALRAATRTFTATSPT